MQYHDTHSINSRILELSSLLEDYSAGCDADFDTVTDDLEREFAEFRFTINE